ncbi:MAG: hypothetical protein QG599_2677 [Pseudomonadota bacterium]|nr:hypothetical protein [Pseudomonadota bacterium]
MTRGVSPEPPSLDKGGPGGIGRYLGRSAVLGLSFVILVQFAAAQGTAAADTLVTARSAVDRIELEQGGFATVAMVLTNHGPLTWASEPPHPVHVSWHLRAGDGRMLVYDNPRTLFPQSVAPGQTVTLRVRIGADRFPGPGDYRVEFDLVQEGKAWFADQGAPTLTLPVQVRPPARTVLEDAALAQPLTSALQVADFPELGQLWRLIENTLVYTHQEFRVGERRYQGLVAGGGYPQLWARDSATAMHGSRWFHAGPALRDWIDLLLTRQQPDGSIPDWVNVRGETDKNTVETDQEASLVIGAGHYLRITGDTAWLRGLINGESRWRRLHQALDDVWRQRRDPASGLITGAHTIDWGDVELGDCTQEAIYAGPGSHWTVDLYDQAMLVLAARALVQGAVAVGEAGMAALWRQRAEWIVARTRAQLWQPERGYFRMHRHLGPLRHDFDEDALFPMGGECSGD